MNPARFLNGQTSLYNGDCKDVLMSLPDNCIDACCTDPPYALGMAPVIRKQTKRREKALLVALKGNKTLFGNTVYERSKGSPGGRVEQLKLLAGERNIYKWDSGETAFDIEMWRLVLDVLKPGAYLLAFCGTRTYHHLACAIEAAGFDIRDCVQWLYSKGFVKQKKDLPTTQLKPACELIVCARKPISEKTVADNIARWGTGALNVDKCRVNGHGGGNGRWPANVIHDGSNEVLAALPQATRFFFQAKATRKDRAGSLHTTVKPLNLMAYLCRLITPEGGIVLDPFAGSGTTAEAAWREGFGSVLIEREPSYCEDIKRRLQVSCMRERMS